MQLWVDGAGWEAGFGGLSEAGFTGFWNWTGLGQFTKVRIRSGNRQKQDLPDFRIGQDWVSSPRCVCAPAIVRSRIYRILELDRIGSVHQGAYSLRQSSEAGFAGFQDWTGLGAIHRGTVSILVIRKSWQS